MTQRLLIAGGYGIVGSAPMTVGDSESFIGRALIRESGKWAWIEANTSPRHVELTDGSILEGLPMGLLDVPSLAAATGAPNIRFDFIVGESIGIRAGYVASQDLYIEMEGVLQSGQPSKRQCSCRGRNTTS
ncbi:hypothetical protein [Paenibacillus herberti]|uniref:Uncharacterized protein n=1 Tax=Paenibacillus herberti TaxID=1619309 RepID=A0A229NY88_9BACL|nr:hypothetical protein [Paenibacillus herberti]OXM14764.1 hypothetical protein CGZ75_17965 [Paenibacillus herberti]